MGKTTRRKRTPEFKAKVAVEALKDQHSVSNPKLRRVLKIYYIVAKGCILFLIFKLTL